MRSDAETGLYNAGYKIFLLAILPIAIIQNAFFPILSRTETIEEKRKVTKKFFLLLFTFGSIVTVGAFTFSDFITLFVFGKAYSSTTYILKILMITGFVVYQNVACTVPLVAWKKEKLMMYAIIAGGTVNIILNLLFIPSYGTAGAAWATVFSESIVALTISYFFYRTIQKLYFFDMAKLLIFSVVSCLAGYWVMINGLNPVISAGISVVLYFSLVFLSKTITIHEIKGYFAK